MADDSLKDNSGTPSVQPTEEKKFSQTELNNILSKRLAEAEERKQKDIAEAVAKAQSEADEANKISTLQGEERLKAEFNSKLKKIQDENKRLADDLNTKSMALRSANIQRELAEQKLNPDFAAYFLQFEDQDIPDKIKALRSLIDGEITKGVNESLARGAPKAGTQAVNAEDAMMANLRTIAGLPPKPPAITPQ